MIQINFKRTGTDRETEFNVDLEALPAAESQNLFQLIHDADFFKLPEQLGTAGTLDDLQYTMTIGFGDNKTHTVSVNDARVPPSLRPLIEEQTALADAQSA